jgi:hypothetical protein
LFIFYSNYLLLEELEPELEPVLDDEPLSLLLLEPDDELLSELLLEFVEVEASEPLLLLVFELVLVVDELLFEPSLSVLERVEVDELLFPLFERVAEEDGVLLFVSVERLFEELRLLLVEVPLEFSLVRVELLFVPSFLVLEDDGFFD